MNPPWGMTGDPGPETGQAGMCHDAGKVGGWKMWGRGASGGAQCSAKEFGPYLGVRERGLEARGDEMVSMMGTGTVVS